MGTRQRYDNGAFSDVELITTDAEGAMAFYATLFGWTYADRPIPGGRTFHPVSKDGQRIAGLVEDPPRAAWLSYVTVDDLDATAGRVEALGGSVTFEPFDVGDEGRFSEIRDPTGARLALWQARTSIGATLVNVPGTMAWNQLNTTDLAAASAFYSALLGWEILDVEEAPETRKRVRAGTTIGGGLTQLEDTTAASAWTPFFCVEDVAPVAQAAAAAGADTSGPTQLSGRQMALLTDPQGVAFGLVDGPMDD